MSKIIGIDPGMTGAIAFLANGKVYKIKDMPVTAENNGKNVIDCHSLHQLLSAHADYEVWIERQNPRPGNGAASTMAIGRGFGLIEGAVICAGLQRRYVTPQEWKKVFGLRKPKGATQTKVKKMSIGMAQQRAPEASEFITLTKHDGRAEAALIALYGAAQ